jgi:general secretion pathway protein A
MATKNLFHKQAIKGGSSHLAGDFSNRTLTECIPDSLCRHFGFSENPFGFSPDPRYLFDTCTHHEAFQSLVTGTECGVGFQTLIGVPGIGKTTLLFRLLERYNSVASTAFLFHATCDSREFLQYLLTELGADPLREQGMMEMHATLNRFLADEFRLGRRVIVVIDEAQNLDNTLFETVRMLSDSETKRQKQIQIVLAGQPSLEDKLAQPELAQLLQRIPIVAGLQPLGLEETQQYVLHRLRVAGHSGAGLFTLEALETIWEDSHGVPRTINTLCFNALMLAHRLNEYKVSDHTVREVAFSLDLHARLSDPNILLRPPVTDSKPSTPQVMGTGSIEIEQSGDLESTSRLVTEWVRVATGATSAAMGFLQRGQMTCAAISGSGGIALGTTGRMDSGITGECIRSTQIQSCSDTELDSRVDPEVCRQLGIRSIVSIPLLDQGSAIGVVQIFSNRPNAFNHLHLLKLMAALETMFLNRSDEGAGPPEKAPGPGISLEQAQGTIGISNPDYPDERDDIDFEKPQVQSDGFEAPSSFPPVEIPEFGMPIPSSSDSPESAPLTEEPACRKRGTRGVLCRRLANSPTVARPVSRGALGRFLANDYED